MKKKEDNSFQLLFTALVLVVIAVGGTLAWFAHNTTSSVDQMAASITSPTDNNAFDGEQLYHFDGSDFVEYNDGDALYVPGMKKLFRIEVDASLSTKVLIVFDGDTAPQPGRMMKIAFYDQYDASWMRNEASFPTPTATLNSQITSGPYGLTVEHTIPNGNGSRYIYFVLYMDPAAGSDYQDLSFDFKVGAL